MTTLTDVRKQIEEARPRVEAAHVTASTKDVGHLLDIAAELLERIEALEARE